MSKQKHMVTIRYNKDGSPIKNIPTPSRNDQCPCGSGKKFKHCHINDWDSYYRGRVKEFLDSQKKPENENVTTPT